MVKLERRKKEEVKTRSALTPHGRGPFRNAIG
jgi:hypothetical protein